MPVCGFAGVALSSLALTPRSGVNQLSIACGIALSKNTARTALIPGQGADIHGIRPSSRPQVLETGKTERAEIGVE